MRPSGFLRRAFAFGFAAGGQDMGMRRCQVIGVLGCGVSALAVPYVPATAQGFCVE
jgi:hypothetical protein